MSGVTYLAPHVGILAACVMLAVARASYYRSLAPRVATPRPSPPRTLSAGERKHVLAMLHEPRFVDLAPAEVYATLLDEGRYICSERTFYRLLQVDDELRGRGIAILLSLGHHEFDDFAEAGSTGMPHTGSIFGPKAATGWPPPGIGL